MGKIITIACSAPAILLSAMASAAFFPQSGAAEQKPEKKDDFNKQAFYTQFLGHHDYDLDSLSSGALTPGAYYLTLYVNNRRLAGERINFAEKNGKVIPCIDMNILLLVNVDSKFINEKHFSGDCVDISDVITGAVADYNDEESALYLSVPQKYLLYANSDYINPELWDDGVTAFKMSTSSNFSSYATRNRSSQHTFYTGLQSSLNLGAWRVNTKDNIYLSNATNNKVARFTHNELYAHRAIRAMQSRFSVGNIATSGDFFDSIYLTGMTLATNDQMLPFSMRSYLPKIQGIAETNATITLSQGGSVIYETQVPPGEFLLNDFYAARGGDIEVAVRESDGRVTTFIVPYSSVPQLLRQGYQRYSVTAGELRNSNYKHSPLLFEGTYQYGFDNDVTLYGGLQYTTTDYQAFKVGAALNTPVGAFSTDLTRSFVTEKNSASDDCKGFCNTAVQVNYNKIFSETGTGINASVKEAVGKGYATLSDAMLYKSGLSYRTLRTRAELNVSQSLPDNWGAFYVGGQLSSYWEDLRGNYDKTYQASYRNAYERLNYSLSLIQRENYQGLKDRQVYLTFSFPFLSDANRRAALLVSGGYNSSGATLRTAVSGTAGEQQQYGFNTYINTRRGEVLSGGASLSQTSDAFTASGNISQSASGTSYGLGFNSGLVIHPGGLNFSQGMGDSIAIIHAPDAAGIRIRPDRRAVIRNNDFGILRNMVPYQYNEIYLDPEGSGFGMDIDFSKRVVPTEGAVLSYKAETDSNVMKLFQIRYNNGSIPFGTAIKDVSGETISLTGQNSSVLLPYTEENMTYSVSWREEEIEKICTLMFDSALRDTQSGNPAVKTLDCLPLKGDEND